MKYKLICVLAFFVSEMVFAESKKVSRGPASIVSTSKTTHSLSQGELLLQQVKDPSPSFMRAASHNGPVQLVGVCRTEYGAIHNSGSQLAYENCMGSENHRTTGALMIGR